MWIMCIVKLNLKVKTSYSSKSIGNAISVRGRWDEGSIRIGVVSPRCGCCDCHAWLLVSVEGGPLPILFFLCLEERFGLVAAVQSDQVGFVAQAWRDLLDRAAYLVRDASKDQHLLIWLTITDNSHAVVAHVCDTVTIDRVLDVEPHFLVK